jgi:hypothetical protein
MIVLQFIDGKVSSAPSSLGTSASRRERDHGGEERSASSTFLRLRRSIGRSPNRLAGCDDGSKMPLVGSIRSAFEGNGFATGFCPLNRPTGDGVGCLLQVPESLVMLETTIQPTAEVPHAPSAKSQNDDAELTATVGQGIGGSRGMVAVEFATYKAVSLKRL